MLIPEEKDFKNPHQMSRLYIQKHYPEFYKWLLEKYQCYPQDKFVAYLYMYFHNIDEPPRCPVCGRYVPFMRYSIGFQTHCSLKCSGNDLNVKKKKEQTSIKHFGTPCPSQSQIIKDKSKKTCEERYGGQGNASLSIKEKQQQTMLERHGCTCFSENDDLIKKSKQTKLERYGDENYTNREKGKQTCLERYGKESALAVKELREKGKRTCMEVYGVEYPTQSEEIQNKIKQTNMSKYGVQYYTQTEKLRNISKEKNKRWRQEHRKDILDVIDIDTYKYACPHKGCTKCEEKCFLSNPYIYHNRTRKKSEVCTILNPVGSQISSIELFVKGILDEKHISYITQDRKILDGFELDFYIPDKEVAIECNGVYWHDVNHKPEDYHFNKWKSCKEKGIKLISVWEDLCITKPEIVKDMLLKELGIFNLCDYSSFNKISKDKCNKFLKENYLWGIPKYDNCVGIYSKDEELIGVACIKKDVVVSYCTKLGIMVPAGLNDLLKWIGLNKSNIIIPNDCGGSMGVNFNHTILKPKKWYIDRRYGRHSKRIKDCYFEIYDSGSTKYQLDIC